MCSSSFQAGVKVPGAARQHCQASACEENFHVMWQQRPTLMLQLCRSHAEIVQVTHPVESSDAASAVVGLRQGGLAAIQSPRPAWHQGGMAQRGQEQVGHAWNARHGFLPVLSWLPAAQARQQAMHGMCSPCARRHMLARRSWGISICSFKLVHKTSMFLHNGANTFPHRPSGVVMHGICGAMCSSLYSTALVSICSRDW